MAMRSRLRREVFALSNQIEQIPTPTGEIHPVADLFPMMPDDELAEFAADIKTNRLVEIDYLGVDPRCQPRENISHERVEEYAEQMAAGDAFPPLRAKYDGSTYWLYDGFHRRAAAASLGHAQIAVEWEPGTLLDAVEASCSVNATHGLPRNNLDKRRAVRTMFGVMRERGESWSDREVARRCAVSEYLVRTMREELSAIQSQMTTRTVWRGGASYEMDVAGINADRYSYNNDTSEDEPAEPPTRVVVVSAETGEVLADTTSNVIPLPVADPEAESERLLDLAAEATGATEVMKQAKLRAAFWAEAVRIRRSLLTFDPDLVAEALLPEHEIPARQLAASTAAWFDKALAGFGKGWRIVKGESE